MENYPFFYMCDVYVMILCVRVDIYYIGTRVFIVIYIVCVMRVRLCMICVFVIVVCALIFGKDNANREQSVKLA